MTNRPFPCACEPGKCPAENKLKETEENQNKWDSDLADTFWDENGGESNG